MVCHFHFGSCLSFAVSNGQLHLQNLRTWLSYNCQSCRALFSTGFVTDKAGQAKVRVEESGDGRGSVTVRLKHILERECGSHVLQISCTLWVYNCAGLPLALQQSIDEEDSMQMVCFCY